jgi:Secretion system C-terminal sorting domain
MKTFVTLALKALILFAFSTAVSSKSFSQQTLTTINGWNAYVHLPDDYNSTGSQKYPTIIFFPGTGETGTNASLLLNYGPSHFIAQGSNLNSFVVNGQTIKPIIISLQPSYLYPQPWVLNIMFDSIIARWRVDPSHFNLTGLSMGGFCGNNFVTESVANARRINAMVNMSAVMINYPVTNYSYYALSGGKVWWFEGTYDNRGMNVMADTMNKYVAGSARYTSFVGGHCCWNTWYDPAYTENVNGQNWNIYQWMLAQNKAGISSPPTVNCGSPQTITLPVTSVTLTGTATGNNGAVISTTSWTENSGPNTAVFGSPTKLSTAITGLVAGAYVFKLTAKDNKGLSSSSTIAVNVNALQPPAVSAGATQTIVLPSNSITLTGTAAAKNGATISNTSWTESSGPNSAAIKTPTSLSTAITGLVAGVYIFKLTATDNKGLSGSSTLTVNVNSVSQPPAVSAGTTQTITLKGGSVATQTAKFNFSNSAISVSGWTNMAGSPSSKVITVLDLSGITLSSVSTGNWFAYNGSSSYNGNGVNAAGFFSNASISENNWYQFGDPGALFDSTRAQLQATGLITGRSYTIKISGSNGLGFNANPTRYTIKGLTNYAPIDVNLNGTANNGATFNNIFPDASGKIRIFINAVTGKSTLAEVNGIEIVSSSVSSTSQLTSSATASIILSGSASAKGGATIKSTAWSEVSGSAVGLVSPANLATSVTGLIVGTYVFKLSATDNYGLTASSNVTIVVNPDTNVKTSTTQTLQVNLFDGTNPYSNSAWNNWNVSGAVLNAITSSAFKYSDGSASTITATLNAGQGVADNGPTYGGTIAPPEVLRYTSYSSSLRSLTINNIPGTTISSLEIYGSRASNGNSSIYSINGSSKTLVTDYNLSNAAVFSNLPVTNGQITIIVGKTASFNYINGFKMTLGTNGTTILEDKVLAATDLTPEISNLEKFSVYPNPVADVANLSWTSSYVGNATLSVFDLIGRNIKTKSFKKDQQDFHDYIEFNNFQKGIYFLVIRLQNGKLLTQKIIKE